MLEEYTEDSYNARFDTCSYHCYIETHLNARLNVNCWQTEELMDVAMDGQLDGHTHTQSLCD